MKRQFNMKGLNRKVLKAMENSIVEVGITAKNFFVENFRKQGFDDKTVEKWKPRKKNDKRAGRAILVKTGDLRRSIIRNPANRQALSVKITSDLAYSKVHNEGVGKMPKRQFIGDSYNLNEKVKRILIKRLDNAISNL